MRSWASATPLPSGRLSLDWGTTTMKTIMTGRDMIQLIAVAKYALEEGPDDIGEELGLSEFELFRLHDIAKTFLGYGDES